MRPQHLAAAAMTGAATLAIAGFTALGSLFEYPQILKEPTADILAAYQAHQSAVMAWFGILAVGALLLLPMAIGLARMSPNRAAGRRILVVGATAAAVQAIGLSRWFLLVPGVSDDASDPALRDEAFRTFDTLHFWLGTILGETIGYILTAALTVLAVHTVLRHVMPTWVTWLGHTAAALIATGVAVPFGLHAATLSNFAGYVAWSLWLLVTAALLTLPAGARRRAANRATSPSSEPVSG